MLDRIKMVKRKMDESLEQLCEVSWMFSRQPEKDFTRNRKLSFPKLVSFLLAMEGGTLTTELIERFGCSPDTHPLPLLSSREVSWRQRPFLRYSIYLCARPSLLSPSV